MRTRTIKIVDRKLGSENALGQAWGNTIEIDPRQNPKERMDSVVHETLHCVDPDLSEETVIEMAAILTKTLWKDGYRRVEK